MRPEPKFSEMQAVRMISETPDPKAWIDGLVIESRWEEERTNNATGEPLAAGWIYKIQVGPGREPVDIWWPEEKLELGSLHG